MTEQLDAQAAFTGTVAPEGADRFDEAALTRWCEEHVEGFDGVELVELSGAVVVVFNVDPYNVEAGHLVVEAATEASFATEAQKAGWSAALDRAFAAA